jgi:hypothetical protein
MKKLMKPLGLSVRVFFIVIAFIIASAFAEAGSKIDSANSAVSELQSTLSQSFDYCDVYYYEEMDRIMVRVAVNGLADMVHPLIEAGYDETFEGWAEYRSNVILMYDTLLEYVHQHYRDDLTITFHLVSDIDTSRDFISINGGTKSVFDILEFQSAMRNK